mmetsp:Transcript_57253/g.139588  ORF Transcript_57253/g.139588 Transcript_57253/m.139588 type:complete len:593 (+) Transcript_57253:256-2034(+)
MTDVESNITEAMVDKAASTTAEKAGRKTGSLHVGDPDFDAHVNDPVEDATWAEVCTQCCVHTPKEWGMIFAGIVVVLFFLYFFLFGLDLLGTGAKVMGGCAAGSLFGDDTNPVAGLMIGILATVLLQSSSTTTSIIVSLTGAGSVSVKQGIYMIMGANIGTSVTNTIVAMGQMGNGDQLERAFAGATVHDMFNFLAVAILFPVEIISGMLFYLTKACVQNYSQSEGEKWEGPVKKLVSPLSKKVIISNKNVISGVAEGGTCDDFYPIECDDPSNPTKSTCPVRGLIDCDKSTDACPAFFQVTATKGDDQLSGFVSFFMGLVILFICLFAMVKVLQKMLLGMSTRIIYKATNVNGYLAMLIGVGVTILVQSSSITTSTFTPLVGMGIIRLEQMYPITLGANIGTTVTGLLAALLSDANAMQVALSHLFFNIFGIILFYPVPFMRNIPLHAARQLGKATRVWRGFPVIYIIVMFLLVPLLFLGLSSLFTQGSIGLTTLGSILVVALAALLGWFVYWWRFNDGKENCSLCLVNRQRRREVNQTLPDDMEYLKAQVKALGEHTGLVEEDEEANEKDADATVEQPASEEEVGAEESA